MNGFTPLNIQNIGMKKRYTVHLDSTILPSLIILVYVWISSVYAYEKLMQITIITITPIEILLFRRGKQLPPKPFSIYSKSFSIPSTSRSFWYPLFCWAGGDLEDFDNKWRLHYMITYRTTASEPTSLSFFFFFSPGVSVKICWTDSTDSNACIHTQTVKTTAYKIQNTDHWDQKRFRWSSSWIVHVESDRSSTKKSLTPSFLGAQLWELMSNNTLKYLFPSYITQLTKIWC